MKSLILQLPRRRYFGARPEPARRSFGLADPVNLVLLLVSMIFYWRLSGPVGAEDQDSGPVLQTLPYFLGQGVFLWYLVSRSAAILPLGDRGSRLVYSTFFALLFAALVVNYQCFSLMRVHIDPSLALLVAEPGFFGDLTIEAWHLLVMLGGLAGLFGLQALLSSARLGGRLLARPAAAMHGFKFQALCLACFLGPWTLWSYNNHVHYAEAIEQAEAVPLFPPRSISIGLPRLWAALGVDPLYAPIEHRQIVRQQEKLQETQLFKEFHKKHRLPPELDAAQDWNILVLAAESWRWDMFSPEIMPRLWAISQRRGWVSQAHYSTGNSTAEGLHGLLSGQVPLYWLTSYRYRLSPVFFDILKRLDYRTSVLSSSNLGYRSIDEYVFGRNIDSLEVVQRPPERSTLRGRVAAPAPPQAEPLPGRTKALWDLAVAEKYLADLDRGSPEKRFDFLFFYSTHYRYHYLEEFERFRPVVDADFAFFNLYLKMMAPRLLNRYRNSAYYLDFLLSGILEGLERRGELERTIVVITGDHGEEFFEDGRFGHSMALNDYQTRVPLLLFLPEQAEIAYSVTSHADVVPTILGAIGADPALQRLFTGKNLLDYDAARNTAVVMSQMRTGAPMEFALVRESHKTYFANIPSLLAFRGVSSRSPETAPQDADTDADLQHVLALKNHFAPYGGAEGDRLLAVDGRGDDPGSAARPQIASEPAQQSVRD